jgi:hypothetical protein
MGNFWNKLGYDYSHAPSKGIPSINIQVTKPTFPQVHEKSSRQHLGEIIE